MFKSLFMDYDPKTKSLKVVINLDIAKAIAMLMAGKGRHEIKHN